MSKRIAYLISCSDHYNHRLCVIDDYLRSRDFDTIYITSDFDHTAKKSFVCNVPNSVQLHVIPYRKNLSVARIVSHWQFAKSVVRYLEQVERKPDAVVSILPPNFLAYYLAGYKERHPEVKLVFDIFDMWPETFPIGRLKKILSPVFFIWAKLRNTSLPTADFVTTECELFRQRLNLPDGNSATVYLCAEPLQIPLRAPRLRSDGLDLCYLGAINNVIGIPEICGLLRELTKHTQVTLHVIGTGERQQEFMDQAKAAGAEVVYYGAVYDDEKKQEIISGCHFGLNVMKSSVCIGLTMKSVEYFRHGLPIINNIPADTEGFVTEKNTGIQLTENCAEVIGKMSVAECMQMRENVQQVFSEYFSRGVADRRYKEIFDGIL